MKKYDEVTINTQVYCDFCNAPAEYDGKTKVGGMWAYMCKNCFKNFGIGLGEGKGQKLIIEEGK